MKDHSSLNCLNYIPAIFGVLAEPQCSSQLYIIERPCLWAEDRWECWTHSFPNGKDMVPTGWATMLESASLHTFSLQRSLSTEGQFQTASLKTPAGGEKVQTPSGLLLCPSNCLWVVSYRKIKLDGVRAWHSCSANFVFLHEKACNEWPHEIAAQPCRGGDFTLPLSKLFWNENMKSWEWSPPLLLILPVKHSPVGWVIREPERVDPLSKWQCSMQGSSM